MRSNVEALAWALVVVAGAAVVYRQMRDQAPAASPWGIDGWDVQDVPRDALDVESFDVREWNGGDVIDMDAIKPAPSDLGAWATIPVSFVSGLINGPSTMSTDQEDANVRAFLKVIKFAEHGRTDESVYQTLFGGSRFDAFIDHPRRAIRALLGGGTPIVSTAAGAYQILSRTWDWVAPKLGLRDFSPASQDAAAIWLLNYRGALQHVKAGRFDQAVFAARKEWASFPGAGYGQPEKSLDALRAVYVREGGQLAKV